MPPLDSKCGEVTELLSFLQNLTALIMGLSIGLLVVNSEIATVKPCDLEVALNLLGLDVTSPCTYNGIKKMSTNLRLWGRGILAADFFLLIILLAFKSLPKNWKLFFLSILAVAAIMFAIVMIEYRNDVLKIQAERTHVDYDLLKSTMIKSLENNYTSDSIMSSNAISNNWNKFFIEYNCCAIHQVQGTTNDFDRTPWCTTSGSCQANSSQIPKTCCNGVSEDDYENAPTTCHSSVNSGTYKSNCMMAIRLLSVRSIEESIPDLKKYLFGLGISKIAEVTVMVGLIIHIVVSICKNKKKPKEHKSK